MLELIAGVVVAFVAVGAVLQPMLTAEQAPQPSHAAGDVVEFEDLEESASPKVQALLALKEIEFDRATGKLSDADYEELKAKYSRVALQEIEREEAGAEGAAGADDAAEALVRQVAAGVVTVCPSCGPRPEADAVFCSDCGKPLTKSHDDAAQSRADVCDTCGTSLSQGAKFCAECGAKVS